MRFKKSFVMLIAVMVLTICLTMAFSITAFADGEAAADAAEAPSAGETLNNGAIEASAPESNPAEVIPAADTQPEAAANPEGVPGQEPVQEDLQQNAESPEGQEADSAATEPEEIQESVNNVTTTYGYVVTISDTNGNSIDVTGGAQTAITDVLTGLGYEIGENAIIEVDQSTVDTGVVTVSENEDGQLVLTDKGPFSRAAQNMIVYVNGVAIELELVDPATIGGSQTTESIAAAFNGASGTDVLNVKLTGDVTVTGTGTANSIVLCAGTHDLYLEAFTLTDNRANKDDYLFTIGDGVTLNVYCKEDSGKNLGKVTGSNKLFLIVDSGILNYVTGSVAGTTGSGIDFDGADKATQIKYGGAITSAPKSGLNSGYYYLANNITANISIGVGQSVTLDLNGKTISAPLLKGGSVISVTGNLTLTDSSEDSAGKITGGKGTNGWIGSATYGGGVYVYGGTFTMNGGTVTGNKATNGGGVYNTGTFTMNGGTITGNTATDTFAAGGGVYNSGTFTMNGGTITGNTATGTFAAGGGVYQNGTMTVGGTAVINENTSNNLYLPGGKTVAVSTGTPLAEGAAIGVTLSNGTGAVTGGNSANFSKYFTSDSSSYAVVNDGTGSSQIVKLVSAVAVVSETGVSYASVQAAVDAAANGQTVQMIASSKENVTIASGKTVTLDLNGKTLKAPQTGGSVITNNGTLTLTDSSAAKTGKVTDGTAACGGGVNNSGTLTMTGGTITGNAATYGGVYNSGTFIMTGGTITGNTAAYGGGVYNSGTMTVGGTAVISGNTDETGASNIYLPDGKTVAVSTGTPLADGAEIGVTLAGGTGAVTGGNSADYSKYFTSDNDSYIVINEVSGGSQTVELAVPLAKIVETGARYVSVQAAVDAAANGRTVQMIADSKENVTIANGKTVTLDLNGKTLTAKAATDTVITNNGTFILTDTAGGGKVTGGAKGVEQCGTMTLAGKAEICGNTANLYLPSGRTVTVADGFTGKVGVTLANGTGAVTGGNRADYSKYFTSDNDDYIVFNEGSGFSQTVSLAVPLAKIVETGVRYVSVQAAVDAASNGQTVQMIADSKENVTIAGGKTVTLDLNGYVLKGTGSGSVITNNGALTLTDSSAAKSGTVTGGSAMYGGGVNNSGTFTITGGIITGNAAAYGGGVYQNGTMTVGGTAVISGNTGGNLYLPNGRTVAVSAGTPLAEGAEISVTTEKNPDPNQPIAITSGGGAAYLQYFKKDNAYTVYALLIHDGEVRLGFPTAETGGKIYFTLDQAIEAAENKGVVTLLDNITGDVNVGAGKNITLDLNGKFIKGDVIVTGDGKLVIDDFSKPVGGEKQVGGINGGFYKDEDAVIAIRAGVYSDKVNEEYIATGYVLGRNRDKETMCDYPYKVMAESVITGYCDYIQLVDTTDESCEAAIEIAGGVAGIYVVDENGNKVDPVNVTILEPAMILGLGAKTAEIRFTGTFTVVLDIRASMRGNENCVITIDKVNGVVTVACNGAVIFSADITDILDTVAELVYDGTSLRACDAGGNVIKEFEI